VTAEKIESKNVLSSEATKLEEKTSAKSATKPKQNMNTSESVVALSLQNSANSGALRQLPNNRPIEASHLNVVSTYNVVGGTRPVVASGIEVSGTLSISGNRPISTSHLKISETYSVMGSRPVASNEIDDPEALMGYLD